MKYTNQRVAILDFLKENKSHPTAEEIFDVVKQTLPRISKATVYKNLITLADNNLIKEVNVKGVARFEANTESHHHIICITCGKIIDYESRELIDYALNLIKDRKEFVINNVETNFYGYCANCYKD